MTSFTVSVVEQAVLAWPESIRWQARNGAEIAPGEPAAGRDDYGQVVLARRLSGLLLPLVCGDPRFKDAAKFVGRAV